jgi:hypothetical protein
MRLLAIGAEVLAPTAQEETRVDFYKQQLHVHRHRLPPSVTYHCVDGYYAKKKYIDEVVSFDLHAITKLRSDADCLFLYTGPHPKRRGARRKYDGKVNFQTLSRFEDLGTMEDEPHLHLYTNRGMAQDASASLAHCGAPQPERPGQAAVHCSGLYWPES